MVGYFVCLVLLFDNMIFEPKLYGKFGKENQLSEGRH
jgi:hypothetical protein